MTKLLGGVTHVIVEVPSRSDSDRSGVVALVNLCFGPGDDAGIAHIQAIRGKEHSLIWRVPHVEVWKDGKRELQPVFRGELMHQVCAAAARALDRIKRDIGRPQYGKKYRITNRAVEARVAVQGEEAAIKEEEAAVCL